MKIHHANEVRKKETRPKELQTSAWREKTKWVLP